MLLRRYLVTNGFVGQCPDWYAHIQAAKYLGVAPDQLLRMPIFWRDKAIAAMSAEAEAQEEIRKRHETRR